MSLDKYVFPGPRWHWKRIDTSLEFGPVDNLVRVSPEAQKPYEVFVSVPTEFIKFIYDVLKEQPAIDVCRLYLDQEVEGKLAKWAFGFVLTDMNQGKHQYDLWYYNASGFPSWARR